jgi:hypothetical protein
MKAALAKAIKNNRGGEELPKVACGPVFYSGCSDFSILT